MGSFAGSAFTSVAFDVDLAGGWECCLPDPRGKTPRPPQAGDVDVVSPLLLSWVDLSDDLLLRRSQRNTNTNDDLLVFGLQPAPPPPPPPPPPIPELKLPINVFIGGGGKPGRPKDLEFEIFESEEDELPATDTNFVIPDGIMGADEYVRERAKRTPRTTSYVAGPDVEPDWVRRARLLVEGARSQGLGIRSVDVARLTKRLNIFEGALDRAMVGGSLVRVRPSDNDELARLAELAKKMQFRIVSWGADSLFLFDETTFRKRVPGYAYLLLGAGMGLWVGSELWGGENNVRVGTKKTRGRG